MISKKILDKVNFVAELLTSDTILADEINLMKLLVQDTIANTSINGVQFRLVSGNRTTSTEVLPWTSIPVSSQSDIYSVSYTPSFTDNLNGTLEVKITDSDNNVYLIQHPNINLKVI